jgi:hypothetical protein
MISTYHSHETRTITVRGKEVVKHISVLDYNKSMTSVDLDRLLHSYFTERKRMNKWYMKLFRRLLNTYILNAMIIYRSNTGKSRDQLSFRVQLVEGLFVKYVSAVEYKVLGRHLSDNTVPRLTEIWFISKIPPTVGKSIPEKRCVVSEAGEEEGHCTGVTHVAWDSASSVFATTTPS